MRLGYFDYFGSDNLRNIDTNESCLISNISPTFRGRCLGPLDGCDKPK